MKENSLILKKFSIILLKKKITTKHNLSKDLSKKRFNYFCKFNFILIFYTIIIFIVFSLYMYFYLWFKYSSI